MMMMMMKMIFWSNWWNEFGRGNLPQHHFVESSSMMANIAREYGSDGSDGSGP
jgi:hypothetical protein